MRFTLNAFIVSTVALLSLITPVVNAVDVGVINSPSAGQTVNLFQPVDVTWTITSAQHVDDVNVELVLLQKVDNPSYPLSPGTLQDNVSLLSGQSNGPVTIKDVTGDYMYMALIVRHPPNPSNFTFYARSANFTII